MVVSNNPCLRNINKQPNKNLSFINDYFSENNLIHILMNEKLKRDKNGCTDNMATMLKKVPLGWSKKKISEKTGINIHSVEAAIKALYNLFHVNSFAQLTRIALKLFYYVETVNW